MSKDSRPTIKFSEATGPETKRALERYRDEEGHRTFEGAVEALLPEWSFRSPKELEQESDQ